MNFSIPDHPSTIDGSPRNQRGAGPSNRSRDISYRDVYNEGQSEGVYYGPAAQTRGWRTAIATPTRGKAFVRNQEVKVREPGTGRFLVAFVVRDTNPDDKNVLVTTNGGRQFPILNDPTFIS